MASSNNGGLPILSKYLFWGRGGGGSQVARYDTHVNGPTWEAAAEGLMKGIYYKISSHKPHGKLTGNIYLLSFPWGLLLGIMITVTQIMLHTMNRGNVVAEDSFCYHCF